MTFLREQGSTLAKITVGEEYDEEVRTPQVKASGLVSPRGMKILSRAKNLPHRYTHYEAQYKPKMCADFGHSIAR